MSRHLKNSKGLASLLFVLTLSVFLAASAVAGVEAAEIAEIDVYDVVKDVTVLYGTSEEDALAELVAEITIKDSVDVEHVVALDWSIADYDGDTAGDYTATGTFELPPGVIQTDPPTALEVTAKVTVEEYIDLSGFDLAIRPSGYDLTNNPANLRTRGVHFFIDITNAKNTDGDLLNGTYSYKAESSIDGVKIHGPRDFVEGARVPQGYLTLRTVGTHELTLTIKGDGIDKSVTVQVEVVEPTGVLLELWRTGIASSSSYIQASNVDKTFSDQIVSAQDAPNPPGWIKYNGISPFYLPWNGEFEDPTAITLEAVRAPGWRFKEWKDDVSGQVFSTSATYTFNLDSHRIIRAVFEEGSFSDVPPTHTFYLDIEAIYAAGIASGYGDGRYGPSDPVSRGQMAAFLNRALGLKAAGNGQTFTDVPLNHTYYNDIEAVAAAGIAGGYGDGRYGPSDPVTRGQMAAFLARALGLHLIADLQ